MIGVVLAVRDQAQYVGEAIDSVLAQSVPASQIVLVDDASVDDTAAIARERGATVVSGPGKGPAIARNIGVRELETEFISFLDGDDRYTPDRNRLLLEAIDGGVVAGGRVREFYDPGREAELSQQFAISDQPTTGSVTAMLMRRSEFDRHGGFSEEPGAHDFFGLMHALGTPVQIDDVVLERRVHGANRSIVDREGIRQEYLRSARAAILARRGQS